MEPYLGEIKLVSFNFAPKGWAFCNGQVMSISQNQALYSLIGTTYGGDGRTNFALPNFRGRVPLHFGAEFPLGFVGGMETCTLASNEIPAHTHTVFASDSAADAPLPTGSTWALMTGGYAAEPDATMNPAALKSTGGQPHENRQPYLVLNFVIALTGLFPPRE